MLKTKLFALWFILFIIAIDLYTRRPNGTNSLIDAYYTMLKSSLLIQCISLFYWYIAIPFTIPKSLYIIFVKN